MHLHYKSKCLHCKLRDCPGSNLLALRALLVNSRSYTACAQEAKREKQGVCECDPASCQRECHTPPHSAWTNYRGHLGPLKVNYVWLSPQRDRDGSSEGVISCETGSSRFLFRELHIMLSSPMETHAISADAMCNYRLQWLHYFQILCRSVCIAFQHLVPETCLCYHLLYMRSLEWRSDILAKQRVISLIMIHWQQRLEQQRYYQ